MTKISGAPNGTKECLKRLVLDSFRHEAATIFLGLLFSRVFSILFTIELFYTFYYRIQNPKKEGLLETPKALNGMWVSLDHG